MPTSVDPKTAPGKRPQQNIFTIGDTAIDEGMPPGRRRAFAILQPDDGSVANEFLWEFKTGKYGDAIAKLRRHPRGDRPAPPKRAARRSQVA